MLIVNKKPTYIFEGTFNAPVTKSVIFSILILHQTK